MPLLMASGSRSQRVDQNPSSKQPRTAVAGRPTLSRKFPRKFRFSQFPLAFASTSSSASAPTPAGQVVRFGCHAIRRLAKREWAFPDRFVSF